MQAFGVKPFTRYSIYKAGGSTRGDQRGPSGKEPEVAMLYF